MDNLDSWVGKLSDKSKTLIQDLFHQKIESQDDKILDRIGNFLLSLDDARISGKFTDETMTDVGNYAQALMSDFLMRFPQELAATNPSEQLFMFYRFQTLLNTIKGIDSHIRFDFGVYINQIERDYLDSTSAGTLSPAEHVTSTLVSRIAMYVDRKGPKGIPKDEATDLLVVLEETLNEKYSNESDEVKAKVAEIFRDTRSRLGIE
jgi:hypothetical protein